MDKKASEETVLNFLEAHSNEELNAFGTDTVNKFLSAADPSTEDYVTEDEVLDTTLIGLESMSDDQLRERLKDEEYSSRIDSLLAIGTKTPESEYNIDNEQPIVNSEDSNFDIDEDIASTNFSAIQTERRAAAMRGQENPMSFATSQVNELLSNETFVSGLDAINEFRSGTLKGAQNIGATIDEVSQNLANYIFDAELKPQIQRAELNTNIEKAGAIATGALGGVVGKGATALGAAGSAISAALGDSPGEALATGAMSTVGGPLGKFVGGAVKSINPLAASLATGGAVYGATGSSAASLAAGGIAAAAAPKLAKLARPAELLTKGLALALPQIDFARDSTVGAATMIKDILKQLIFEDRKEADKPKNELTIRK